MKQTKEQKLFLALVKLVQIEFNVPEERAKELVGKTADYNIESSADVLSLIKKWVNKGMW